MSQGTGGLKQFGLASLTLKEDGSQGVDLDVEPSSIFNFQSEHGEKALWPPTSHRLLPNQIFQPLKGTGPLYVLQAANEHYTFVRSDYMKVSFFQPCAVYLLLVETSRVPQWLRNDFARTKIQLQVEWAFSAHAKVMAILSQQWSRMKAARIVVWEHKDICMPNVQYTFGGSEGNSPLTDYTYILAWQPLPDDVIRNAAVLERTVSVSQSFTGRLPAEKLNVLQRQIVEGVQEDNLLDLYNACRAYARSSSGARATFLVNSGVPLTTVAAMRNAQPQVVMFLVSQGAELDATGWK